MSFICFQGVWIFFIILQYFGLRYAGLEESNLYIYFWVIIVAFVAIMISKKMLNRELSKPYLFGLLTVTMMIFLFYTHGMKDNRFFYIYIAMCSPSTMFGIYFAEKELIRYFSKYYLWLILISIYPFLSSFFYIISSGLSLQALRKTIYKINEKMNMHLFYI